MAGNAGAKPTTEDVFVWHDEYEQLLLSTQRRRPITITAPALIRHIGFWRPPSSTLNRDAHLETKLRRQSVDTYIQTLLGFLEEPKQNGGAIRNVTNNFTDTIGNVDRLALFASYDPPIEGRTPDPYRSLHIRYEWHGLPTFMAFELHSESVELTIGLDCSVPVSLANDNSIAQELHSALRAACTGGEDKPNTNKQHSYLYYDLWAQFDDKILRRLPHSAKIPAHEREKDRARLVEIERKQLGLKVLEFRGLVMGVDRSSPILRFLRQRKFAMPGYRSLLGKDHLRSERQCRCDIDGFNRLHPYLRSIERSDTELTISRFLNGRAYYATLMNVDDLDKAQSAQPICYMLYEHTSSAWELGRLVYRIHHAGAARIGAIMHYGALRRAGENLRRATAHLADALAAIAQAEVGTGEGGFVEVAYSHYRDMERELNAAANAVEGEPLAFRLQRSRFYVAQFNQAVEDLRIERVEGYQPYHEFVRQRIGAIFDYVDKLSEQLRDLDRDRNLYVSSHIALQQTVEAKSSAITQKALHKTQEALYKTQEVAEVALLGALLPYYLGHVLTVLAHHWFSEGEVYLFFFVTGLYMAVPGMLQLFDKKRRFNISYRRGSLKSVAAVTAALGLLFYVGHDALQEESVHPPDQTGSENVYKAEVHSQSGVLLNPLPSSPKLDVPSSSPLKQAKSNGDRKSIKSLKSKAEAAKK